MHLYRLVAVLLLIGAIASGQQPMEKHFVRASADAVVVGKPDRAQISIGVRTQATSAKAAAEQNARQTTQVLDTLKSLLGTKGEIQTSDYSISPHYEMSNNMTRENGFDTSNTVQVTVDDLSLLPAVLDAASRSGANNINGISFSLKDDSALKLMALGQASTKARASAEAIAQALSLKVVGVANAEAGMNGGPVRPMMALQMNGKLAASTPIEAGNLEIHANVTVTLEVNP